MTDQTKSNNRLSRRRVLQSTGTAALVGLAGCTGGGGGGDDGGDGGVEFTFGSNYNPDQHDVDDVQAYGYPTLWDRVEENSDISVNRVGQNQICTEGTCPEKVAAGSVEVGTATFGNASSQFPALDFLVTPYLWPSGIPEGLVAQAHAWTRQEMWESFWVPFAQEHGVLPIYFTAPTKRDIMLGTDIASSTDERFRVPSDIEGLDIRRTLSRVPAIAIDEWGANPVNVAWADTIQGLKSGVVNGLETYTPALFPFGMAESVGEIIGNTWSGGSQVAWANLEWLKSLSSDQQDALAEQTKTTYEEVVKGVGEGWANKVGYSDPPPEGSAIAENDITMNILDDDEVAAWREPVDVYEHPDLYDDILTDAEELTGESDPISTFGDLASGSGVPSEPTDFEIEAWWDDIIDQV